MSSNIINNEAVALLVELGFPREKFDQGDVLIHHAGTPSLAVKAYSGVGLDYPCIFSVEYTGERVVGLNIPRRWVDTSRPRWRTSLLKWHQNAVFTVGEIQRRKEVRESERLATLERVYAAVAEHIPAECNISPESVAGHFPLWIDADGKLQWGSHLNTVHLPIHRLGVEEFIPKLARLLAFLEKEEIPFRT